jgi:hypothetical protein
MNKNHECEGKQIGIPGATVTRFRLICPFPFGDPLKIHKQRLCLTLCHIFDIIIYNLLKSSLLVKMEEDAFLLTD